MAHPLCVLVHRGGELGKEIAATAERRLREFGAEVVAEFSDQVTHVLASRSFRLEQAAGLPWRSAVERGRVALVGPDWTREVIRQRRLVDCEKYLLFRPTKRTARSFANLSQSFNVHSPQPLTSFGVSSSGGTAATATKAPRRQQKPAPQPAPRPQPQLQPSTRSRRRASSTIGSLSSTQETKRPRTVGPDVELDVEDPNPTMSGSSQQDETGSTFGSLGDPAWPPSEPEAATWLRSEAAVDRLRELMQEAAAHLAAGKAFDETIKEERQMAFLVALAWDELPQGKSAAGQRAIRELCKVRGVDQRKAHELASRGITSLDQLRAECGLLDHYQQVALEHLDDLAAPVRLESAQKACTLLFGLGLSALGPSHTCHVALHGPLAQGCRASDRIELLVCDTAGDEAPSLRPLARALEKNGHLPASMRHLVVLDTTGEERALSLDLNAAEEPRTGVALEVFEGIVRLAPGAAPCHLCLYACRPGGRGLVELLVGANPFFVRALKRHCRDKGLNLTVCGLTALASGRAQPVKSVRGVDVLEHVAAPVLTPDQRHFKSQDAADAVILRGEALPPQRPSPARAQEYAYDWRC